MLFCNFLIQGWKVDNGGVKSKKDDVDLQEKILKLFQNKKKKAKKSKNLFITDFKAGVSPINNLPLKWSYDDIMNGYKLLDNNIKFQFVNVFNQKSTIKLDLVLENDNKFIEFSENYYFDLKNNKKGFFENFFNLFS